MSKRMMIVSILLMSVLLSACGSKPAWDNEEVSAVSHTILTDEVTAEWTLDGSQVSGSGVEKRIRLEIKKKDGARIDEFDVSHEKLLHLIVISKDLSYFNHIHPEYKGNGMFEIANRFPAGGEYRLIADFKPTRGSSMTKMAWVRVEGASAAPAPVIPDAKLDNVFEGNRVKLSIDQLEANKELTLKFSIADSATGQPVADLEPYLGSIGHVVILTEDGERYVHVHALDGQGTGPDAIFETTFPKSGIYKIWGQFQREGRVFTSSYVVHVP
ncbi:hypothetical protein FE783_22715 [Paenibacillus mesophilus]|uniref:hypothetical protein n=1 Tax=Paenibacillus mesophilus TaxID=2582849 RepID=UPI00110DC1D3|nr:hypothetical protein [Paenibacillus mesophilus]TMV47410.1 hypothetical protein FE783_22715 [Paenibacillus mesophilus]